MKKFLRSLFTTAIKPLYSPLDLAAIPIFWILIGLASPFWFIGLFGYLLLSVYITHSYFYEATLKEGD